MAAAPKVIQIGFNKCGTRSMHQFFLRNGHPSIHWEDGLYGRLLYLNVAKGLQPFEGFEEFVFYSDLMGPQGPPVIEGHFYFREMHAAYPDAFFILNTRREDDWIASRQRHRTMIERFKQQFRLETDGEVEELWRAQWRSHHAAVTAFFADKPGRFLLFDIDRHDGGTLAAFLDGAYALDPRHWGHFGKSAA